MNKGEYFISGIDTYCGKTYITGHLALGLKNAGSKVITSKLVQTGCIGISEDIVEHRRIMQIDLLPEDKMGLTCPFVYSLPASPHLSAKIDNRPLDIERIKQSTQKLLENYDIVLTEGAGGLMVPLTERYLTIDYIRDNQLPLILVTSSKLGSINHTLLSMEMALMHNIQLHTVIYNQMPNDNTLIANDSYRFIEQYLQKHTPNTNLIHGAEMKSDKLAKLFL